MNSHRMVVQVALKLRFKYVDRITVVAFLLNPETLCFFSPRILLKSTQAHAHQFTFLIADVKAQKYLLHRIYSDLVLGEDLCRCS